MRAKIQRRTKVKTDELIRVEIIFSQAVKEDFFDIFRREKVAYNYTVVSNVTGSGCSNPKMGDAIWPQLNELMIIFCSEEEANKIVEVVQMVRKIYPAEGIACFLSTATSR